MTIFLACRAVPHLAFVLALAGCAVLDQPLPPAEPVLAPEIAAHYAALTDGEIEVPSVPAKYLSDRNIRREVDYWTDEKPGTVIVDPWQRSGAQVVVLTEAESGKGTVMPGAPIPLTIPAAATILPEGGQP